MDRFPVDSGGLSGSSTPKAAASSGSGLGGWLDVKVTYGAKGDGATDDSAAIQSAINAAKSSGGTVYFPPGDYVVGTTLNCDLNAKAFALRGPNQGAQYQSSIANLIYSGTATGASGGLMHFNSASGWELCYLGLEYSNPAFVGDLVNVDGNPHAADSQDFHIHHCTSRATSSITANSAIRFNKAVIGHVDSCHFTGAVNSLRIGDPGGSYVIALQIDKCTFNFSNSAHILIGSGDCEALAIRDCTFEAGTNTTAIAGSGCGLYSPVISGNWFGDASSATNWITGLTVVSTLFMGTIGPGNRFATPGPAGKHIQASGTWLVYGNTFEEGTIFDTSTGSFQPIVFANYFNNIAGAISSGGNFQPRLMLGNASQSAGASNVINGGRIGVGWLTGDLPSPDSGETMYLGTSGNLVATGQAGAVYRYHAGGNPFATVLQAPSSPSGDTREAQIAAGATPIPVIRVQKNAIGFYNIAPQGQPGASSTTAGYTVGASTAVTIDGKFTGNTGLSAPLSLSAAAVATGGTFAAGTYFWKVTAINAAGETLPSNEATATIVLNGSATLGWTPVVGASSYKVYRATTTGGEGTTPAFVASVAGGATSTYTDTGTAVSAGAVPAASTANTAYTIADVVKALKTLGLLAG